VRTKILIADDHRIFAEALCKLLSASHEVIGTAENGRELVNLARELDPDVIVLDISMPLLNGMEALRMLRKAGVRGKFVMLTMHTDVTIASEAFRCGASAFVLKQAAGEELNTAITAAMRGRYYLSSSFPVDLVTLLAEAVRRPNQESPAFDPPPARGPATGGRRQDHEGSGYPAGPFYADCRIVQI